MIVIDSFRDETVAVVGLARSGLASVRALLAGGARVLAWDDDAARRTDAAALGAEITSPEAPEFDQIAALILSPGIPHTWPEPHPAAARAKASDIPIIGDVELLIRAYPALRLIGVTGTNGKSTVTALIGHILEQSGVVATIGGNIGLPVLDLEAEAVEHPLVLELSSYQLELTPSLACEIGVLVNISADHLDRHGGMEGYVAAKQHLVETVRAGGVAIIGVDDERSAALCREARKRPDLSVVAISNKSVPEAGPANESVESVGVADGWLTMRRGGEVCRIVALTDCPSLPGAHNAENAAAAAAIALTMGVGVAEIGAAMVSYPGLPHRQERVGVEDGITYINDSKATNAEAAGCALSCYEAIYWIAGGVAKAGGIAALAPYFPHIRHAFLIGESAGAFAATLAGAVPVTLAGTLEEAVPCAHALAGQERREAGRGGAVVLLSPAAASFDQFASYEARGDRFRDLVSTLIAPHEMRHRRAS